MIRTLKAVMGAMFALIPFVCNGQTENPRGIYKMMTVTGKQGEIIAPFDQYKICTDSITLMLSTQQSYRFRVSDNDHKVFNYTGEQPKDENDRGYKIFDSNAEHFTMKWWSKFSNHSFYPQDDWVTEKYEANKYSEVARCVFEALTAMPAVDKKNPLLGTWRVLGRLDDLKGAKNQLKTLKANYAMSEYAGYYITIAPSNVVYTMVATPTVGGVERTPCQNKDSFTLDGKECTVKWISKEVIGVEIHEGGHIHWDIMERPNDGLSLMSRIASQYMSGVHE